MPRRQKQPGVNLVDSLSGKGAEVSIFDPWVSRESLQVRHQSMLIDEIKDCFFDGIVIAVAHQQFRDLGADKVNQMCGSPSRIFDVKGLFSDEFGFQRL